MLTVESAIFLLVSVISGLILHSQIQKSYLFVVLSILLALLLVFFSRFSLAYLQQKNHRLMLYLALFLSSFFVQILIIATGGLFSAFVILLHLFTLGMSVLFNVSSAIVFLLMSVGLLMSSIYFDPQMKMLFEQDPWSVVLHGISFLVVIPLAHMLVSTYHLKDAISKMLSETLKTKELQDQSIFRGIGELVFILDRSGKVIFANEAVKRSLSLQTNDLVGSELTKIVPLQTIEGVPATNQTLSIDQAIEDKSAHLVKGFYLRAKAEGNKLPVVVQVRPIYETEQSTLKQIVVVITPDQTRVTPDQVDIQMAYAHSKSLMAELETELSARQDNSFADFQILMSQINDLSLFQNFQNHGIVEHKTLVDGQNLIKEVLSKNSKLLIALQITIDYLDTQEGLVKMATTQHNNTYSLYSHVQKNSLANVDPNWMGELLTLLIKLFSLINTDKQNNALYVRTGFNDTEQLVIMLTTKTTSDVGESINDLLIQNYGSLRRLNDFNMGSGLEGILSQKLAESLNIEFKLHYDPISSLASCTLILPTASH